MQARARRGAVGAEAVSEFDAAQLEVLFELGPFLRADVPVFIGLAERSAAGERMAALGISSFDELWTRRRQR